LRIVKQTIDIVARPTFGLLQVSVQQRQAGILSPEKKLFYYLFRLVTGLGEYKSPNARYVYLWWYLLGNRVDARMSKLFLLLSEEEQESAIREAEDARGGMHEVG
jgi:hypothetical protein